MNLLPTSKPPLPSLPTMKQRRKKYESPTMAHFRQKVAAAHQTSICNATKVGRRKIRDILQQEDPLFQVPIFQRRYCWNENQWDTLLADALVGKEHSLGRLTCTNVNVADADNNVNSSAAAAVTTTLVAPNDTNENETKRQTQLRKRKRSVILDGQQRFTTITLILASIRDKLCSLKDEESSLSSSTTTKAMFETINKLLFADMNELSSWIENSKFHQDSLYEGVELSFAKLIPTFCDRWSYYTAILPKDDKGNNQSSSTFQDMETTNWHRPLKAKQHFDSRLKGYTKEQLTSLANSVLDNFHMLYFPIDLIGRNDGTEDLMVVYERLAMRDATFCKPTRDNEFVSMDGIDMIRNLLLGSFPNESETIQFYTKIWLPIERLADSNSNEVTTSSEKIDDPKLLSDVESTAFRTMKGMIQSFLSKQNDFVEQDAGTIGGKDYADFQFWLDGQLKKNQEKIGGDGSKKSSETLVVFKIGESMLDFAKNYFVS